MDALNRAIVIAGSQKSLADKTGVVQSAVANWLRRGSVPAEHCLAIEIATDGQVTRQQLRPNDHQKIWGDTTTDGPPFGRRSQSSPNKRSIGKSEHAVLLAAKKARVF
ncbi:MAG: transcriptional regulator [Polaromonas sp.]